MRWYEINETITAYHSSDRGHPAFDVKHIGNNSHIFGDYESVRHGIFFTDNPKFAGMYSDVMEYDLNIKNTYDMDKNNSVVSEFISWFKESGNDLYAEARDTVMNQPVWHLFEDDLGEAFVYYLHKIRGFDSASFTEEHDIELSDGSIEEIESKTIVVFNPSKVIKQGQYDLDLWEHMRRF